MKPQKSKEIYRINYIYYWFRNYPHNHCCGGDNGSSGWSREQLQPAIFSRCGVVSEHLPFLPLFFPYSFSLAWGAKASRDPLQLYSFTSRKKFHFIIAHPHNSARARIFLYFVLYLCFAIGIFHGTGARPPPKRKTQTASTFDDSNKQANKQEQVYGFSFPPPIPHSPAVTPHPQFSHTNARKRVKEVMTPRVCSQENVFAK